MTRERERESSIYFNLIKFKIDFRNIVNNNEKHKIKNSFKKITQTIAFENLLAIIVTNQSKVIALENVVISEAIICRKNHSKSITMSTVIFLFNRFFTHFLFCFYFAV